MGSATSQQIGESLDLASKADPASVNRQDSDGRTPLSYAAQANRRDIVRTLLLLNASPTIADNTGQTPLHWAATSAAVSVISALVSARGGADINAEDAEGRSPLHRAVEEGHGPTCYVLLCHGAHVDRLGATVREQPVLRRAQLKHAVKMGDVVACASVLDRGMELQADGEDLSELQSALSSAVATGAVAMCRVLLRYGADPNRPADQDSVAPVHQAACLRDSNILLALLERGARVEAKSKDGRTPLHYAVQNRSASACAVLLERGASVDHADVSGQTPLHCAARIEEAEGKEIMDLLIDKGANVSAASEYAVGVADAGAASRLAERLQAARPSDVASQKICLPACVGNGNHHRKCLNNIVVADGFTEEATTEYIVLDTVLRLDKHVFVPHARSTLITATLDGKDVTRDVMDMVNAQGHLSLNAIPYAMGKGLHGDVLLRLTTKNQSSSDKQSEIEADRAAIRARLMKMDAQPEDGTRECGACQEYGDETSYSKKQWKAKARRCRNCVAAGIPIQEAKTVTLQGDVHAAMLAPEAAQNIGDVGRLYLERASVPLPRLKKCSSLYVKDAAALLCVPALETVCFASIREIPDLVSLVGLGHLSTVTMNLVIAKCPNLTSLNGLEGLTTVEDELRILDCPALTSLAGLAHLREVREVRIRDCPRLVSIDALASVESCESVQVMDCPQLSEDATAHLLRVVDATTKAKRMNWDLLHGVRSDAPSLEDLLYKGEEFRGQY